MSSVNPTSQNIQQSDDRIIPVVEAVMILGYKDTNPTRCAGALRLAGIPVVKTLGSQKLGTFHSSVQEYLLKAKMGAMK